MWKYRHCDASLISRPEHNLALQQRLYDLRSETKDAFEEAKRLEVRWKELEKEQREVYQVRSPQTDFSMPFVHIHHSDSHHSSFCYACVTVLQHKMKHLKNWLRPSSGKYPSNNPKGTLEYPESDKMLTSSFETSKNHARYIISEHYGQRSGPMGKSSGEISRKGHLVIRTCA
jgi:hypothetical protein